MQTPLRLKVWIVEPHHELRALLSETAPIAADILAESEFRRRIDRGLRPDALMIDGSALLRLDGQRPALEGSLRTLVVTGRSRSELPAGYLERPSVRYLRKPFRIEHIERGLRWLAGADDESWCAERAASAT